MDESVKLYDLLSDVSEKYRELLKSDFELYHITNELTDETVDRNEIMEALRQFCNYLITELEIEPIPIMIGSESLVDAENLLRRILYIENVFYESVFGDDFADFDQVFTDEDRLADFEDSVLFVINVLLGTIEVDYSQGIMKLIDLRDYLTGQQIDFIQSYIKKLFPADHVAKRDEFLENTVLAEILNNDTKVFSDKYIKSRLIVFCNLYKQNFDSN